MGRMWVLKIKKVWAPVAQWSVDADIILTGSDHVRLWVLEKYKKWFPTKSTVFKAKPSLKSIIFTPFFRQSITNNGGNPFPRLIWTKLSEITLFRTILCKHEPIGTVRVQKYLKLFYSLFYSIIFLLNIEYILGLEFFLLGNKK